MFRRNFISGLAASALGFALAPAWGEGEEPPPPSPQTDGGKAGDTYTEDEIVNTASDFFGIASEAVAKAVQRVFRDLGQPNAYIKGDEGSAAFLVGLRYGSGWLMRKGMAPKKLYWRGPSVGADVGGNASKVFTLVYSLNDDKQLYRRFPGVEGSYYFIAGIGVLYMRKNGITIAPMRTGVGLRAGINAQYQEFTEDRDWFPF